MTSIRPRGAPLLKGAVPAAVCAVLTLGLTACGGGRPDGGAATSPGWGSASATPDARGGLGLEAWVYPGSTGEPTCQAPKEYRDGRLRFGVLKPEYWQVAKDGTLALKTADELPCNGFSDANAADIKAHSAAQYVTVSAADRPNVAALVDDPGHRADAVTQLVAFTKRVGFTGVDIDFEDFWAWSQDDEHGYEAFVSQLAGALHDSGLRLQLDGPLELYDGDSPFDYAALDRAGADQLVVMAYDRVFNTPTGKPCWTISPHDWVRTGVKYAQSKVTDPAKLVVGLANYGFSAPDPCDTGKVRDSVSLADTRNQPGYSEDPATVAARRDADSGEVRWTEQGTLYDYVDRTGMDAKLAVLKNLGVSEVSVWVLGGNPWFSDAALGG